MRPARILGTFTAQRHASPTSGEDAVLPPACPAPLVLPKVRRPPRVEEPGALLRDHGDRGCVRPVRAQRPGDIQPVRTGHGGGGHQAKGPDSRHPPEDPGCHGRPSPVRRGQSRKRVFLANFALRRRLDDSRISRINDHGPRWQAHQLPLASPDGVDDQVRQWLAESIGVGLQDYLYEWVPGSLD